MSHKTPPLPVTIKGLTVTPMTPVGQQYRRSYDVLLNSDNLEEVMKLAPRISEHIKAGYTSDELAPADIAPALYNFVTLQAKAVPVDLDTPSGKSWSDELASFILEVEYTPFASPFPVTCYVTGYVSGPLFEVDELFDEHAIFHINSIYEYRDVIAHTPDGPAKFSRQTLAAQILTDPAFSSIDTADLRRLRPQEIISQVASADFLKTAIRGSLTVVDTRSIQSGTPVLSNYAENDPTIWAQTLLEAHVKTISQETLSDVIHQQTQMDRYAATMRAVRNPAIYAQPFLKNLTSIIDGVTCNRFTLKDLRQVDKAFTKEPLVLQAPKISNLDWTPLGESDLPSFWGSYIANSVPALMAKYGIRTAQFAISNHSGKAKLSIWDFDGIHRNGDSGREVQFMHEVRVRVMDNLSYQNQLAYSFAGKFDLFGNSVLALTLNRDGKVHDFISPTFANAIFSPQLTSEQKVLENAGEVFEQIFTDYEINTPPPPSDYLGFPSPGSRY